MHPTVCRGGVFSVSKAIERAVRQEKRARDNHGAGRDTNFPSLGAGAESTPYLLASLATLAHELAATSRRPQVKTARVMGPKSSVSPGDEVPLEDAGDLHPGRLLATKLADVLDKRAALTREWALQSDALARATEDTSYTDGTSSLYDEKTEGHKMDGAKGETETDETAKASAQQHLSTLWETVVGYNPTLDGAVVARVAARLQSRDVIPLMKKLRTLLQKVGPDAFLASVLPRWKTLQEEKWLALGPRAVVEAELRAGIVGSLSTHTTSSSSSGRRRPRLTGFVRHASDFQVNEVLPNERVVTFTQPTHIPDGSAFPPDLNASLKKVVTHALRHAHGEDAVSVYLHFVLYREVVPLSDAFQALSDACNASSTTANANGHSGPLSVSIHISDFTVNVPLAEDAVAVQTCSLRVRVPRTQAGTDAETLQAFDKAIRAVCRNIARRLVSVNTAFSSTDRERGTEASTTSPLSLHCRPRLQVQLLDWRAFPCSAQYGVHCGAQYAVLLRGLLRDAGRHEALVMGAADCVPNFYGPRYFGDVACPLRWYDVAAASEAGYLEEAILMATVLTWWPHKEGAELPVWVHEMWTLLASDEDRAAAWRQPYHTAVPEPLRQRAREAKAALLWNVVLSCRLSSVAGGGRASAGLAPPEPGDFVLRASVDGNITEDGEAEDTRKAERRGKTRKRTWSATRQRRTLTAPCVLKPELLPVESLPDACRECQTAPRARSAGTETRWQAIHPVFAAEDAADCTASDLVAPLDLYGASEALRTLAQELGFPAKRASSPYSSSSSFAEATKTNNPPPFRPLFARATGFPRARGPWAKAFLEPSNAITPLDAPPTAVEYRLATDADLATEGIRTVVAGGHEARVRRDFAARSRGAEREVWPIGRQGRPMAARLPPGILASAALSRAGPLVSSSFSGSEAASPRSASMCLALHFTLGAEVYSGMFLREFILVESQLIDAAPLTQRADSASAAVRNNGGAHDDGARGASTHTDDARESTAPKVGRTLSGAREWSEGNLLSLETPRSRRG